MARIRTIKPEFWTSETIAALPIRTRLTFIGLWTYVDDNGVGFGNEKLIVAELFPLEDDPLDTLANVSRDMQTLSDAGLIVRYVVDGKRYIAITSWTEHQKIDKPGKARHPGPDHQDAVEDQVHTEGGGAAAKAFAKVSRKSRDTPSPGSGNREQGTGEQGTGIAPGPADAVPPPADVLRGPHPAVSYVLTVQTNTGAEWGVTAEMVGEWQKTFPGIDVLASLRRARQWSLDNPTRRKTTSGMRKFLGGWLGRDNDDPRTPRIGATAAHRTAARLQTPDPSANYGSL